MSKTRLKKMTPSQRVMAMTAEIDSLGALNDRKSDEIYKLRVALENARIDCRELRITNERLAKELAINNVCPF